MAYSLYLNMTTRFWPPTPPWAGHWPFSVQKNEKNKQKNQSASIFDQEGLEKIPGRYVTKYLSFFITQKIMDTHHL